MGAGTPATPTLAALGAIAFVAACVGHEAVGHGGICLATGGRIDLLTSVYFHCSPGRPLVDAAGPLANLALAALAFGFLIVFKGAPLRNTFLALFGAFNGFWGAGYFLYSAVTNTGDWAFVLRDLSLQPAWLWRIAMAVLGAFLYGVTLRAAASRLPIGPPLWAPYLVAGAVACLSTIFYSGATLPALREAAQESLLASAGLAYLALRRPPQPAGAPAAQVLPADRRVLVAAVAIVVVFWFWLGRGVIG